MEDSRSHKAVALRYDQEKDAAPLVVAKGRGLIAERIKIIAEENDIPLRQDKSLADYLMALDLYEEIPAELYLVIAEILAFVYSMDKKY
ncbi:flagellar biosynthesis protein flhb [hydrocarbon metagenome]|uniref:Flagellar biosynthesis protein flhb n=1 Tax=hydrocarbon metagenome TaxID=938273 RepID=A0A0W8E7M2_9ZZZZ